MADRAPYCLMALGDFAADRILVLRREVNAVMLRVIGEPVSAAHGVLKERPCVRAPQFLPNHEKRCLGSRIIE
jgi:hypothetical protein